MTSVRLGLRANLAQFTLLVVVNGFVGAMIGEGAIITASGRRIPSRIDTVCVHGDTPGAVAMARELRAALEGQGVEVAGL